MKSEEYTEYIINTHSGEIKDVFSSADYPLFKLIREEGAFRTYASPSGELLVTKIVIKRTKNTSSICFGSYYSQVERANKNLFWHVLYQNDAVMMLLCDNYLLDYYCGKSVFSSWEYSNVRRMLNERFFTRFFSESEKKRFLKRKVLPHRNSKYDSVWQGGATVDRVFLLSAREYEMLIDRKSPPPISREPWYLRTMGKNSDYVTVVRQDGSVDYDGKLSTSELRIRPAILITR